MIQRTIHVLAVPDLEASAAFYRDVLGFSVHEIGDPGWRMFVKDGGRIMAGECPDAIPAREVGDHSYARTSSLTTWTPTTSGSRRPARS